MMAPRERLLETRDFPRVELVKERRLLGIFAETREEIRAFRRQWAGAAMAAFVSAALLRSYMPEKV